MQSRLKFIQVPSTGFVALAQADAAAQPEHLTAGASHRSHHGRQKDRG
jgi:hypothetical protein